MPPRPHLARLALTLVRIGSNLIRSAFWCAYACICHTIHKTFYNRSVDSSVRMLSSSIITTNELESIDVATLVLLVCYISVCVINVRFLFASSEFVVFQFFKLK